MHRKCVNYRRLEALYHYLWKHRMYGDVLTATTGERVEILNPGIHNNDCGPDFSAALLRIDGLEWGGNVEIHTKASDWQRHGHHKDSAYDTVILHVVGIDDAEIKRTDGTDILQTCVAPPADFYDRYVVLTSSIDTPSCLPWIERIPRLNRVDWLESLGTERLQEKGKYIKTVLGQNQGDWHQTLFIVLARALGFGLNGVPFEMLAKSLPLNYVMRHRDNRMQIEALLFGQAGMLVPGVYDYDSYYVGLCKEYEFLQKKYNLTPIKPDLWRYSKTRPMNFPHRRIAHLSGMLAGGLQLFTGFLEARGDYDILMECLEAEVADYWHFHSRFGEAGKETPMPVSLSKSSREIILINLVAPFYLAYGSMTGDLEMAEKGADLLNGLKAERNSIVSMWGAHGVKACSAFDSQALIHLRRKYCDQSRCLECRFGHYLLRESMR